MKKQEIINIKELLEEVLLALNYITNQGYFDKKGNRTNTYTLASKIGKELKS